MERPEKNDAFEVSWNDKNYTCSRVAMGDTIVFVVAFTTRPLYLSKAMDAGGASFWVSIPVDTKLSRVVRSLGEQIDEHYK